MSANMVHSYGLSFMKRTGRCGHTRRPERSRKTKFLILQGPRGMAHHTGPHGKDTRVVMRHKTGGWRGEGIRPETIGVSMGKSRKDGLGSVHLSNFITL